MVAAAEGKGQREGTGKLRWHCAECHVQEQEHARAGLRGIGGKVFRTSEADELGRVF